MRTLDFGNDLQWRGVYKSIAMKRQTGIPQWPLKQWEWEVVDGKPNKSVSSSTFYISPLSAEY